MITRLLWAMALLATGAFELSDGWAGWLPPVVFVVAVLLPFGLVPLGAKLGLPTVLVAFSVVGLAALGAYVAAAPSGAGLLVTVRDAVPRLLTAPRPAPATPEMLMPGALLCVLIGTWVAVRTLRQQSALIAPPTGSAVLYTAGALLTAGRADRFGIVACGLVVLAVAGWVLLDRSDRPAAPEMSHAAPALALCAGLALLAGALPMGGAFEPRELVDPPRRTLAEPSPLPRIAAWLQQGDTELLRVRAADGIRLRLVTLTKYTGALWVASEPYRPLGGAPPPQLPAGQRRVRLAAEVTVATLSGPWLPTVGDTTSISLPGVDVDPESGSLALRSGGLRRDLRFRVSGDVDLPRIEDVTFAAVPTGAAVQRNLEAPRLPWVFAEYARRITRGATSPLEQAVAIEHQVRLGRRLDSTAPTGSSYARLQSFLFQPAAEPGGQKGTSEQFATSFAILARSVGLPTRIVVGFRPGDPVRDAPPGVRAIHGRDALAWPEVYFSGWGWLAFDPTPQTADARADDPAKQQVLDRLAQQTPGPVPSPFAQPVPPPVGSSGPPVAVAAPEEPKPGLRIPRSSWLGLVLLVVVPLGGLRLARALRRVRHRRAGDRGAWSEVLDLLILLRRAPPRWQPAPEIAAGLAAAVPVPGATVHPALRIAVDADRATFAPDAARRRGPVGQKSWRRLKLLRHSVRRVVPWYRRLLWPFDPRPLRRR